MFIGQEVVCVDDRFPLQILDWASNLPRKDRIYTIHFIGHGESIYTKEVKLGLILRELQNGDCFAFFAERFVPLVQQRDEARQATIAELLREVGDAAMIAVAQELRSGTLPESPPDSDDPICEVEVTGLILF